MTPDGMLTTTHSTWLFLFVQSAVYVLIPTDLFEKMVPMVVQQSMSVYTQRKADTVNRLVGTMREATNLCNGYADLCLYGRMLLCTSVTMWPCP